MLTIPFLMIDVPTAPLNVEVSAERILGESITIMANLTWMRPQNFDQFDIDRYDINVTSTSSVQTMTTACGECTSAMATVSDISNVPMNTNFTFTIAAVNLCGETGPVNTTSYNLGKLLCFATISELQVVSIKYPVYDIPIDCTNSIISILAVQIESMQITANARSGGVQIDNEVENDEQVFRLGGEGN